MESDIVVVGAGLAGISAALNLAANGRKVLILDKATKPGGNSIKASSGINGVPTKYQPVAGDSVSLFTQDTLKSGKFKCDEKLVEVLVNGSRSAINWLCDQGIDLLLVTQLGGHSMPRTPRGSGLAPPGYSIISTLLKKLETQPNISIKLNSELKQIHMKNGLVDSVEYLSEEKTRAVNVSYLVLATGGYAADTETVDSLVKKHRPELIQLPTTNAESISGDGQKIASRDCNVKLINMEDIQINPTGFVDLANPNQRSKILCGELLRGIGGIMISPVTGKRFVDELQTRDVVSGAVFSSCELPNSDYTKGQLYMSLIVVDEVDYTKAKTHIDFYVSRNLLQYGTLEDIVELAQKIKGNVSLEQLISTFKSYGKAVRSKDEFGRKVFGASFTSQKYYFGLTTPVLHFSMGGIAINEHGQALDNNSRTVPNLYAIGEIAGGVHGKNRLGGNSLLECVVFAKQASDNIIVK